MKIIDRVEENDENVDEEGCIKEDLIVELMWEVQILTALSHPQIIKFYEFYEDSDFLYVVMEYCAGGELFQKLLELTRFMDSDASKLAKGMLSAVEYLHSQNVVHRDIKAENFVFAGHDIESGLKMIDFGMAAYFERCKYLTELCGSPHYLAPEMVGQRQ